MFSPIRATRPAAGFRGAVGAHTLLGMPIVGHLLNAAKFFVILDAVLSWVMADDQLPRSLTKAVLDPVYDPIRAVLGGDSVDFSPLIVLGALFALELLLKRSGAAPPSA